MAFLIAALETCLAERVQFDRQNIPILILSPTRELAIQIQMEAERLVRHHKLRVVLAVGGTPRMRNVDQMIQRADLVIGTPGRVSDLLSNEKEIAQKFNQLKYLVLDEADQLLDMGFKKELETINSYLNPQRSTLMFSATLSPEVRGIASTLLKSGYRDIDTVPKNEVDTHLKIKQSYLVAPLKEHFQVLHDMIEFQKAEMQRPKIIVFFPTTKMVQLATRLFASMGIQAMELHSKKDQRVRARTSDRFRAAQSALLFTSDVSARGVDYPNVTLVVSFGIPPSRDTYIHRIGRTGRAGKDGEAILLLSPFEKKFLNLLDDLPIQEELRLSSHPTGKNKELSDKIADIITKIDPEELSDVAVSSLGFSKYV